MMFLALQLIAAFLNAAESHQAPDFYGRLQSSMAASAAETDSPSDREETRLNPITGKWEARKVKPMPTNTQKYVHPNHTNAKQLQSKTSDCCNHHLRAPSSSSAAAAATETAATESLSGTSGAANGITNPIPTNTQKYVHPNHPDAKKLQSKTAANEITIDIMSLSGDSLTLQQQAPVRVSDLMDHIHRERYPSLHRIQIKLVDGGDGNRILQDTENITKSTTVNVVISGEVQTIRNRNFDARAFLCSGKVECHGDERSCARAPAGLEGVKKVVATRMAFAALKDDGTVIAWGFPQHGGSAPAGLEGVKDIVANEVAFAALKSDGSVTSWGCPKYGAFYSQNGYEFVRWAGMRGLTREGVKKVVASDTAFGALKFDGSEIAWGDFEGRAKALRLLQKRT